jgi:hypothetical protein
MDGLARRSKNEGGETAKAGQEINPNSLAPANCDSHVIVSIDDMIGAQRKAGSAYPVVNGVFHQSYCLANTLPWRKPWTGT